MVRHHFNVSNALRRIGSCFCAGVDSGVSRLLMIFTDAPKRNWETVEMLLSKKHRERAREIACDCWIQSAFHEPRAIALTKKAVASDKSKGTYGNPLMALMIAYYVASLAYMAYKFWRDQQVKHPPEKSVVGEPFGLCGGDRG